MLLTMEEECKSQFELFPNPERIDKVIFYIYIFLNELYIIILLKKQLLLKG